MKVIALAALAVTGCNSCHVDLERMIDQPRFTTYEACDVCPEGTIMMQPPAGTVARTANDNRPAVEIPIAVDAALLARGKNRFDIYCAACHGHLGNGTSQVAENMTLRPPPNLLVEPYASRAPGALYLTITAGYGLMRSYAGELPVRDRWAVIAYLQVLQLSQHLALGELPETRRAEARRWLK